MAEGPAVRQAIPAAHADGVRVGAGRGRVRCIHSLPHGQDHRRGPPPRPRRTHLAVWWPGASGIHHHRRVHLLLHHPLRPDHDRCQLRHPHGQLRQVAGPALLVLRPQGGWVADGEAHQRLRQPLAGDELVPAGHHLGHHADHGHLRRHAGAELETGAGHAGDRAADDPDQPFLPGAHAADEPRLSQGQQPHDRGHQRRHRRRADEQVARARNSEPGGIRRLDRRHVSAGGAQCPAGRRVLAWRDDHLQPGCWASAVARRDGCRRGHAATRPARDLHPIRQQPPGPCAGNGERHHHGAGCPGIRRAHPDASGYRCRNPRFRRGAGPHPRPQRKEVRTHFRKSGWREKGDEYIFRHGHRRPARANQHHRVPPRQLRLQGRPARPQGFQPDGRMRAKQSLSSAPPAAARRRSSACCAASTSQPPARS